MSYRPLGPRAMYKLPLGHTVLQPSSTPCTMYMQGLLRQSLFDLAASCVFKL